MKTDDHPQWKVAPHYLKPLVEGEATQVNNVATISGRQHCMTQFNQTLVIMYTS
ncbi:MAG: hypothetical protein WCG35_01290 [Betaproteobacteria bacterium]